MCIRDSRKVEQMVRKVRGKDFPVTHVVFSDGLASVSLFIEPLAKDVKPKTLSLIHI